MGREEKKERKKEISKDVAIKVTRQKVQLTRNSKGKGRASQVPLGTTCKCRQHNLKLQERQDNQHLSSRGLVCREQKAQLV